MHLHPRWQRLFIEHLGKVFPNIQFIVTSHSPLIVQAAGREANLALLTWQDDHVVIDNTPAAVHGWRADQILTALFGLPSARSREVEDLLREQQELLEREPRSKEERQRLNEVERRLAELPTAESPEDREAMDLIRRAAVMVRASKEQPSAEKPQDLGGVNKKTTAEKAHRKRSPVEKTPVRKTDGKKAPPKKLPAKKTAAAKKAKGRKAPSKATTAKKANKGKAAKDSKAKS